MANVIGTEGVDLLRGTAENDTINSLGGDDRITSSTGVDTIDGGNGNDVVDYTNFKGNISIVLGSDVTVGSDGSISSAPSKKIQVAKSRPLGDTSSETDLVTNIETIIGSANQSSNTIESRLFPNVLADIDLSINRFTYTDPVTQAKTTLNIKNFNNAISSSFLGRLKGNDGDNQIESLVGGLIIGSKGNDTLNPGIEGIINTPSGGTFDYSDIGTPIKVLAAWKVVPPFINNIGLSVAQSIKITKGSFGTDTIINSAGKKIIGATNKANTLNASSEDNQASLDLNLKNNSLKLSFSDSTATRQYEVVNFVNVVAGKGNDTIVGANKNAKLTGGGGSDIITGGDKNDVLTGSDRTARGVGELDTLTGGGGRDKFVLGDANGAYYVGKGKEDYATITDFNLFQDSISLGGFKNYSFGFGGNNSIELYSGKDVNTRDLIAKIQLTGGFSNRTTNSRSMMGTNSNIDAIVGNIDILSGANVNA
jgi:Ca2+-binding RTX toxin-like protein